jgi:hypothetical protein
MPPSSESLPDWLHDSGAESAGPPPETPAWMDSPAQPPAPDQTNQQAALPDWLRDTQPSPPAGAGSEQLPDWLRDLAGDDAPAPEPPPAAPTPAAPPAAEDNLPDWLRDTQRDTAPPAGSEQLPAWLAETVESPGDAEPPAAPGGTAASLGGAAESPVDAPMTVPDWLSAASDTTPATSGDVGAPDWLNAGAAEQSAPAGSPDIDLWAPEAAATPEQPRGASAGDTSVPDWLRNISAEDANDEITAEPFSFEGATGDSPRAEPAGPPSWLSSGEDTAEAVPDWLRSAVTQSEDLAGAAPQAPDVPLWLQDIGGQPAEPTPAPALPEPSDVAPAPSAEPGTLPPWLSDEVAQPPSADAPAADVPAWLREPEPTSQAPSAHVPAWLQPEPADQSSADVPAWLHEAEPAAEAAPSEQLSIAEDSDTLPGIPSPGPADMPPESAPPPAEDLPDWLRPSPPGAGPDTSQGQDLPPWLRDEAGQPLPTASSTGDTNLPAWLRGASAEPPPAAPAAEPPAAPASFEWLDEAAQSETRRASAESEFFGGTELPAWLRPPEPEPPKEINQADARSLDWLTRLGGADEVEVAAPAAVAVPRLTPPVTRSRTPAQVEALALMQRLAAAPFAEPGPVPAPAQPSVWRRIGIERAVYLALLIALLIGLTVPLPESFGLAAPLEAPGAPQLFGRIDQLSENDVVLIGYEWDARRSSELRPLEDAVLSHLIQRKVKLVLASTDPQGTLLLFDFRDQLERAGYRKGGEDYILLGYKPGAELALRSFAQDFRAVLRSDFQGNDATISALATGSDPSQPRLSDLSDLSMMLVLADEPQDVQGWMEQVHRSARQVPFGFLLPAETAPVVQPYLSQPGIFHLAGKQGALAYQNLRGGDGMPAERIAREAAQQRLSLLVFAALLLVGAIVVGASAAARRGRST